MPQVKRAELHYLELLTTICLAEGRAGTYLKSWADKTAAPELKACLALVAARETSHYEVFERRIEELGYTVQEQEDPGFQERLRVLGSEMADSEKIRWQRGSQQRQQQRPTLRERYEAAIADETIDPLTRSLLRWFADEEADSRGLLAEAYASVEAKAR
jgi:Mn-containing catalase